MLLDCRLVQRVDHGHMCSPTHRCDAICARPQRGLGSANKEHPRALAREGLRDAAANESTPAIHNGVLPFQ